MLVVVSILTLLITIAGYNHHRVLNNSRDAALKIELSQLRNAVYQYALDNKGVFPSQLSDLAPKYIREIPQTWSAGNVQGKYFYEKSDGMIYLYDKSLSDLSQDLDQSGTKYGKY